MPFVLAAFGLPCTRRWMMRGALLLLIVAVLPKPVSERIRTAMITGESSSIAKARGAKLGVDSVVLGARRKGETVDALRAEHGLPADAVAYIGDDLLDIPAMQRAGLAVAVADATAPVKAAAHVVTRAKGGHGAVRECVELILRAQKSWARAVDAHVREHGGR